MSEVRSVVEAHVDALNHGDLSDILRTFTPDASFHAADGIEAEGRVQLAGLFDAVAGEGRPQTILRRANEYGQRLVCTLTRRFPMVDESGVVRGSHEIDIKVEFTVRDGAIAQVYVDPI